MKDRPDAILHLAQACYLEELLPRREPLLEEMEALAESQDIPISDPEVGRLLEILARASGAQRILEIGTAIGYGALCLARGAPGARIVTVDSNPERLSQARQFLSRGGVAERVELLQGEAVEAMSNLEGPFDLAYLDAAKADYRPCLDLTLPRLREGGLIVLDNLLWKGWVAGSPPHPDPDTEHIRSFNTYFMSHPELQSLILPLGDGVGIGVKRPPASPV